MDGGKRAPPILHTKDKIFEADRFVEDMKTRDKQKRAANKHHQLLEFDIGDWVLLRFEKARLRKFKSKERLYPKLIMRYYGPFQVLEKINDVSYGLQILDHCRIHNAFHVILLRPFKGEVPKALVDEQQPEIEELNEILQPQQILAHKERKVKSYT